MPAQLKKPHLRQNVRNPRGSRHQLRADGRSLGHGGALCASVDCGRAMDYRWQQRRMASCWAMEIEVV